MNDRYTFKELKDEELLVEFLERVWKAGFLTREFERVSYEEAIKKYMPDFKKQLSA